MRIVIQKMVDIKLCALINKLNKLSINMKKATAILAAVAFLASASTANAWYFGGWGQQESSNDNTVNVNVSNGATVTNNVTTKANTGANETAGGDAGNTVSGSGNNGGNDATGGDADVVTGAATAVSDVLNNVNGTDIKVVGPDCGCEGDNTVNVNVSNGASVANSVYTKANTGYNGTFGGDAGNTVEGSSSSQKTWWKKWWGNNNGSSSNGGNDATGGDADVETGDAVSGSVVTNYVNQTMVRVRR